MKYAEHLSQNLPLGSSQRQHVRPLLSSVYVVPGYEMEGGGSGDCAQPAHFLSVRTLGTVLEQDRPVWLSCCRLTLADSFLEMQSTIGLS